MQRIAARQRATGYARDLAAGHYVGAGYTRDPPGLSIGPVKRSIKAT